MKITDMKRASAVIASAVRKIGLRYDIHWQEWEDLKQAGWVGVANSKGTETTLHIYVAARCAIIEDLRLKFGSLKRGAPHSWCLWNNRRETSLPTDTDDGSELPIADDTHKRQLQARETAEHVQCAMGKLTPLQFDLVRMVHWDCKPIGVAPYRYNVKLPVARMEYANAITRLRQICA